MISGGHYLPIAELLGTTDYEIEDINGTRYYTVRDGEGNLTGAAFVGEQRGFNGSIRYLIALDDQYAVQDLIILEHKEDPGLGARITSLLSSSSLWPWPREQIRVWHGYRSALSGATISSC